MLRQLLQRFAAWLVMRIYGDADTQHWIDECADMDHVHVTPIDDLIEHEYDEEGDCPCGPEVRPVEREDGSIAWLYVHNALDGRDLEEIGQGVPMENPHGLLDEFDGME